MNILISTYKNQHQNHIIKLIEQILNEEYSLNISFEASDDLFHIDTIYQSGNGNFWVATMANEVVGTLGLKDIGNNNTDLRRMYVSKQYRGSPCNVGKKLMDAAELHCRNHQIKSIFFGTAEYFDAAHKFYKKMGFHRISKNEFPPNFYPFPSDTLYMKKDI